MIFFLFDTTSPPLDVDETDLMMVAKVMAAIVMLMTIMMIIMIKIMMMIEMSLLSHTTLPPLTPDA